MTKTILIVEDNELNMKVFNDLLQAEGYETILSSDGTDALKIAKERHLDLIIMDIQLPQQSGLKIIKDLKADKNLNHITIIAVTAFAMRGDEEEIREAGGDDYISKPISVRGFLDTVAKHLS